MSGKLTPDQLDDFVNLTLNKFHKHKWTDLSTEFQHYTFAKLVNEKRINEDGGDMITFFIKTQNTGTAKPSGLFDHDYVAVEDLTIRGSVGWTKQVSSFAYDIDEDGFQSDREKIISILKIRDHAMRTDMADLNEAQLWGAPTDPQSRDPMGIPFWLQKSQASVDGDFMGGNPSGFAAGCAGIDSNKYSRYRNWTFTYERPTTMDLVRKVKKALRFTKFRPPVPHPEMKFGATDHQMFTTERVLDPLERLAESRNDNLGTDVAKYMNQVTIGGVPIEWVPMLHQNDLSDPIYGINWGTFRPYVKKGASMRRSKPKQAPGQNTVRHVFLDNWMNYICVNRRENFVGVLKA